MAVDDTLTLTPPDSRSGHTEELAAGNVAVAAAPSDEAARERGVLTAPTFIGPRQRSRSLSLGLRVSVPLALVLAWWIGTSTGWIPPYMLAKPSAVFSAFKEIWQSGDFWRYVVASFWRIVLGLSIGLSVGLVLGVLAGLTFSGEELIDPTMQMFRAVPFLALVPLFLAWFGIGEMFKVALIATGSALPMYAYAYLGVRNVDRKLVEAARGFGLKRWRLVTEVILPSAMPNVLMALRICLVLAMTALITAEGIGTDKGIGYLVLLARQYARTDYTMLCVLLYAALGLFFDVVIRLIERYSMPWRRHTVVRG